MGSKLSLLAATAVAFLTVLVPAAQAAPQASCREPADGAPRFEEKAPAQLGFDGARLDAALDAIARRNTGAVAVYRFGCRAGARYPQPEDRRHESYSVAKSVTAMALGRAMELGLIHPDDRVGGLVPEASRRHGALTMRQLLHMASGLKWNFFRDYNVTGVDDHVKNALGLPFDHEPGTWFEYAQAPVALVAKAVGNAADEDFGRFVDRELFRPVGIPSGSWDWQRDRAGNVAGFYGLRMRESSFARLGQLLLQDGVWRGRRLLDRDFVAEADEPSPANPGYGFFFWTNKGDSVVNPTISQRDVVKGPNIPGAPRDLYAMFGFLGQKVIVVPSLSLVITRFGIPGGGSGVSLASDPTLDHDLVGGVLDALSDPDLPPFPPYVARSSEEAPDRDYGIFKSATELDDLAAAAQLAPPLPAAGPRRARALRVRTRQVRLAKRTRTAAVTVACPPVADRPCAGPLELAFARGDAGGSAVGRSSYDVPAGQARTLRVRLSAAARRIVGRAAKRRGRVLVVRSRSADTLDGTPSVARVRVLPARR